MDIKKTILISAAVCFGLTAAAVPARKGVRTFLQADGTEISLYLVGDEFQHTFATLDGLSVMRCDDGNFHYRTAAGVSGITAHNSSQRTEYENEFKSECRRHFCITGHECPSDRRQSHGQETDGDAGTESGAQ